MSIHTLITLILSTFILKASCLSAPVIYPEANIYGTNEVSPEETIAWSENPDWSSLGDIMYDYGLMEIGLLCVRGAWLLYEKPYYEVNIDEKHMYKLFAGEIVCEKPGLVESMQPFGSQGVIDESSFTYFHEHNFGSKANSLTREWSFKDSEQESSYSRKIASLITIGNDSWAMTVQCGNKDAAPRKMCVRPNPVYGADAYPICSLSNFVGTDLTTCNTLTSVQMGCDSSISEIDTITVSECRPFDVASYAKALTVTEPPIKATPAPPPPPIAENITGRGVAPTDESMDLSIFTTCKPDGTPSAEMSDLLRFLKLRRDNDFEEDVMIPWTNKNEDTFKSELVDATFEIAIRVCPEIAVENNFLHLTRELFMSQLHDTWKSTGSPDVNMEEMELLLYQLRKCSVLLYDDDEDAMDIEMRTGNAMVNDQADQFVGNQLEANYERKPDDNLVIDMAWLAANLVSSLCHKVLDFTSNFWFEYIRMFEKMYLEPLAKANIWRNAKVANKLYEFVLSGFGIKEQYEGFARCTKEAVDKVPNMHPFRKPI